VIGERQVERGLQKWSVCCNLKNEMQTMVGNFKIFKRTLNVFLENLKIADSQLWLSDTQLTVGFCCCLRRLPVWLMKPSFTLVWHSMPLTASSSSLYRSVSVLVDNQTVCECHNIFNAICALFSCYYIFHIMYAPTVENVMLFLDTRVHMICQQCVFHERWNFCTSVHMCYCCIYIQYHLSAEYLHSDISWPALC